MGVRRSLNYEFHQRFRQRTGAVVDLNPLLIQEFGFIKFLKTHIGRAMAYFYASIQNFVVTWTNRTAKRDECFCSAKPAIVTRLIVCMIFLRIMRIGSALCLCSNCFHCEEKRKHIFLAKCLLQTHKEINYIFGYWIESGLEWSLSKSHFVFTNGQMFIIISESDTEMITPRRKSAKDCVKRYSSAMTRHNLKF